MVEAIQVEVVEFKEKVLITTPIYYINDVPHIGHTYTTIAADILARWHRLRGDDVFFLTGLDENSVKTVQAARELGIKDIQKYADSMAAKWEKVWEILNISNDNFIRTTEERHKENVRRFFTLVYEKGDIYRGKYEGLYCEGCEAFITESDLVNGKCALHKKVPKIIKEENYFFKLSKYQDKLLEYIEENPDFIQPESRRSEVISFIREGLKDVSISRPNIEWGIELPIDVKHRFWVWFDALVNYLINEKYWPANVHLIAKDILRFHAIIWPGMLLSADYELPKKIFAHGFLTINSQKISKSLGNIIDPLYLAKKYSVDALRYFLFRETPFGQDGDFSETALKARLNNELVANIGNFIHRTLTFIWSRFDAKIPKAEEYDELDKEFEEKIRTVAQDVAKKLEKIRLEKGLEKILEFSGFCNRYFQQKQPWAKRENAKTCLYLCANAVRILAVLLEPYLPSSAEELWRQLNLKDSVHKQSWSSALELTMKSGHRINRPRPLFKKFEAKKEEMEKIPEKAKAVLEKVSMQEFSKLDLRIGKIVKAEPVPKSTNLIKLTIDVGDSETKQAVAGIAQYYTPKQLEGMQVAVVTNLEPRRIFGVESEVMILAAEDEKTISLLRPERPVKVGSKIR